MVRCRDWLKRGERNGFIGGQVRLKTRREAGVRVKVVVRFHGLVFNGGGGTGSAVVSVNNRADRRGKNVQEMVSNQAGG